MTTRTQRLILLLAGAAAFLVTLAPAQQSAPPPRPGEKPTIEELIEQLNSDSFKAREAASRALLERPDALPALQQALHSMHPEVRRRAQLLLAAWDAQTREPRLNRALVYIKNGDVVDFIDLLVPLEPYADERPWQELRELARRSVARANKEVGTRITVWGVNGLENPVPGGPGPLCGLIPDQDLYRRRIAAREVTGRRAIKDRLILSKGPVQANLWLIDSIVFANGDVTAGRISRSVVVCEGSIEIKYGALESLLIATGTIRAGGRLFSNNSTCVHLPRQDSDALGLLKFFDTRQVGVQLDEFREGLVVERVFPGKPCARAGMRAEDRIVAIDGTELRSPVTFRRLLRRLTLESKETVFTVVRDDKERLNLRVRLRD
jgi:hypothetical protein